jgi:hypothetical protein
VRKTAGESQINAEGDETEKLHEEKRSVCSDTAGGEPRREIGHTPAQGSG